MVWVGLDEVVVAGVGVGRGERAGGDHGEVQDGGWGVGVKVAGARVGRGERAEGDNGEVQLELIINIIEVSGMVQQKETMNIEELFFKLNATRLK